MPNEYAPIQVNSCVSDSLAKYLCTLAESMDSVVELGSWHGKSTHALLSGCKGIVYAVDHFKGSVDKSDATHGQCVKSEFLKNCGEFTNLRLLEIPTEEASKQFEDDSVDMVFIDAGHLYEEILLDLQCWLPKTRKIICGHDASYDSVKRALQEMGMECDNETSTSEYWEFKKEKSDVAKKD